MKDRLFSRADYGWSLIPALLSLALYFWTAAPNVTLLDSGEFIVAAQHFGVPHPAGYPLWTFFTWLFQMIPWGNAAWKINLFSGVCGTLAVGLICLLSRGALRWILGADTTWTTLGALVGSLTLAVSVPMWSQATIAEVYTLHSLLVAAYFLALYAWMRNPAGKIRLMFIFFLLSLAFGHHQLTVTLAPLPFLAVLLLRRRIFWDLVLACSLTIVLVYLGFAILSKDQQILQTGLRFFYCVLFGFLVFVWVRRGRVRWWLVAFLPFAVIAGLLPFAYLPLAAQTNPPMNWSYARDPEGFYFAVNRSQYSGSLSEQSLATLGKAMGVTTNQSIKAGEVQHSFKLDRLTEAHLYVSFYWTQLIKSFSPLCLIFYFSSILLIFRRTLTVRVWIYTLHISFVLAAFLQPLKDRYQIDMASWSTQMPWHAYTYLIFSLLISLGIAASLTWCAGRLPRLRFIGFALLLIPLGSLLSNYSACSQRGHWFGWMYGHDMLKDLPRDSIVIGGTDAGRFVPTYMIFGESPQPARYKRDPDFDRRDLYIITQNALGEPNYMKYLRDHYTSARPQPANAFERWLGRGTIYPEKPILLPDQKQVEDAVKEAAAAFDGPVPAREKPTLVFSAVLKWIWEHNKDRHEFFIEESFPITWTYDYAIPHGLIYKLNKTKLDAIPPEAVAEDFRFWKDYKERLLGDPSYRQDIDAQRSFSKLRQTMGNIYRHRKMDAEAERAYREALDLWPNNLESLLSLTNFLWDRGEFAEAIALFQAALANDPESLDLWRFLGLAERRKEIQGEINSLNRKLAEQPKSRETLRQLLELHASVGDTNNAQPLVERAMRDFPEDSDLLRFVIQYHEQNNDYAETLEAAKRLATIESSNLNNHLLLARAYFYQDKKKEFYETANKVAEMGGNPVREAFATEPIFQAWTNDPEFQKLIEIPKLLPQD